MSGDDVTAREARETISDAIADLMGDMDVWPVLPDRLRDGFTDAMTALAELEAAEAELAEMEADRNAHVDRADDAERRAAIAEARTARLREALARAGAPLEVLRAQIVLKPYAEMTDGFQAEIVAAAELVRTELSLSDGKGDGE